VRERREGGERERETEEKRPLKLFSNGPQLKPKRAGDGRTLVSFFFFFFALKVDLKHET